MSKDPRQALTCRHPAVVRSRFCDKHSRQSRAEETQSESGGLRRRSPCVRASVAAAGRGRVCQGESPSRLSSSCRVRMAQEDSEVKVRRATAKSRLASGCRLGYGPRGAKQASPVPTRVLQKAGPTVWEAGTRQHSLWAWFLKAGTALRRPQTSHEALSGAVHCPRGLRGRADGHLGKRGTPGPLFSF